MENQVVLPTTAGEYPHNKLMFEENYTIKQLPVEIAKQVTALNLGIRTAKAQDKIEANIKKSVILADMIQTAVVEANSKQQNAADIEAARVAAETEAARVAAETEAARVAAEASEVEAKRVADEQFAAAEKERKRNPILDFLTGNY